MYMQKILRHLVIGGLLLTPFSVLIVANSLFFPFITGKAFFYRTIVEIIGAAWLVLILLNQQYRPSKQYIYFALLSLLGVLCVSNILSVYPYKAFWSNFERMDGWITLVHHVVFFVVLSSVFTTYELWQKFWKVSLAVSVVVCVYGFFQMIGVIEAVQGGDRADGTFGNAAYLAVYNIFNIFIAVWLLYKSQAKKTQVIYGLIACANILNLYWSATRGAFVGFAAGVIVSVILILFLEKGHTKIRRYASGALLVLVLFVGSVFMFRQSDVVTHSPALTRITTISLSSGATRLTVWRMALNGVYEKPIFGWGQEGFSSVFATYYEPGMYGQEPWFDRAHNIIIDWLIAGGVVGLAAYLSVVGLGFFYIWKSEWLVVFEKALFSGLYVAYVVQNLFVFDNLGSYLLFFSTLAFFTVGARNSNTSVWGGARTLSSVSQTPIMLGACVVCIIMVYVVNIKPIQAGQEFIRALTPNQKPEIITESFKDALAKHTFANGEITEQMVIQAPGFYARQDASAQTKETYRTVVEQAFETEYVKQPTNARLAYLIGVYYNSIGDTKNAIDFLEKAQTLSPHKQIILFELAFAYINNGETARGMKLLKDTLDLAPSFDEARKMYTLGAIYTDNRSLEKELLQDIPFKAIATDNRFIQAYATKRRFPELLILWEQRVIDEPRNVQNYVSLAATYLQVGRKADAISSLEKAIEIEPRFKQEGEKFIADIKADRL